MPLPVDRKQLKLDVSIVSYDTISRLIYDATAGPNMARRARYRTDQPR